MSNIRDHLADCREIADQLEQIHFISRHLPELDDQQDGSGTHPQLRRCIASASSASGTPSRE